MLDFTLKTTLGKLFNKLYIHKTAHLTRFSILVISRGFYIKSSMVEPKNHFLLPEQAIVRSYGRRTSLCLQIFDNFSKVVVLY